MDLLSARSFFAACELKRYVYAAKDYQERLEQIATGKIENHTSSRRTGFPIQEMSSVTNTNRKMVTSRLIPTTTLLYAGEARVTFGTCQSPS